MIEFYGLNFFGIERLVKVDYSLIIICDIGSINIVEIEYVNNLGIDIIVIDYYIFFVKCLFLFVIINFCYFFFDYFLYNLFGVGVVYKFIEVFYLIYFEIF